MTRIIIYVHNEEMEALKPLQARLIKQGAQVAFSALKYMEIIKCDKVLTTKRHLDTVKGLFAGTGIPVSEIPTEEAKIELPPAPAPTEGVTLTIPEPEPEAVVETTLNVELSEPAETDEEVVITVSEPAPAPAPARRSSRNK